MTAAALGWALVAVAGFLVAMRASRGVADHATAIATASGLSPFVVGLVVLSVGTDLPEIVNSLISSASGHGDLNVGDSIGSTLTQLTLVLGLLPFLGGPLRHDRSMIHASGALVVVALLLGVILIGDGDLNRFDASLLIIAWLVALLLTRYNRGTVTNEEPAEPRSSGRLRHFGAAIGFLAVVAIGAGLAVIAMVEIARIFEMPEYLVSFFGASIGTSMPELIVDVTAIRRGAPALALGDAFGSSLVDATLSLGIGPLFFPIVVDTGPAIRGGLYAAVAVALVTLIMGWASRLDRKTGAALILLYFVSYLVLLR